MQNLSLPCHPRSRWPFRLLAVALLFQLAVRADQIIYNDARQNGWQDWGWAAINYANTSPVHSNDNSISVTIANGWDGIQFYHPDMDSSPYASINFWLNGGAAGGQQLQVYGLLHVGSTPNAAQPPRYLLGALGINTWQQFTVPLSALGVANQANFTGFVIQDSTGAAQPVFYADDISLVANSVTNGTNASVTVQIDALADRHAISPLIYGVAFASSAQLADLNAPLNRSGGNAETRYNWQLNAHNRAADWYFESIGDNPATPGAAADAHITDSKNGGAQAMITIPMIGWMPKLGNSRGNLASYSIARYGAQTGSDSSWMPDAGNGVRTDGSLIVTNDPNDANFLTNVVFQQAYVQHLTNRWGVATNGGVRYYLMDNEHSIWHSTHRDVHPVGASMREIRDKMFEYASMVKSNDPNALVLGPEEFGWSGYFNSGYDLWYGDLHHWTNSISPDRTTNGGWDYLPWLLDQFHQHATNTNQRLLDYFTVHCYPEDSNVSGSDVSTATQLLRNRLTRKFWDTNYVDETWIGQQTINIVKLIPRLKDWVASYYPGTKIGITEYNWGAESHVNGATAQADIMGIFGREGLDLATRWTTPDAATPTYKAMKLYRNYDGNKSAFGDTSIRAAAPNPNTFGAYAAVRSGDGAMTVMVINKDLNNAAPVTLNLSNFTATGAAQVWQLTAANTISQLANTGVTNGILNQVVPAQSITLFVVPGATAATAFSLRIGTNRPPGRLELWLDGQAGRSYIVQSSTNLTVWTGFSTNTLASNSLSFLVATTNSAKRFYRGLLNSP